MPNRYDELRRQVRNGLYIDFEGRGPSKRGGPPPEPVLLGVLIGKNEFHRYIFESRFAPLVRGAKTHAVPRSARYSSGDLESTIQRLIERCEAEDRMLYAYSKHEQEVIDTWCSKPIADRVRERLVNAKTRKNVVKQWRIKCHPAIQTTPKTLQAYLDLIKYPYPEGLRGFKPADVVRRMQDAVDRTQRWGNLTNGQRKAWLDLLRYNWHDCRGLRRLTLKAANGLHAWAAAQ